MPGGVDRDVEATGVQRIELSASIVYGASFYLYGLV